MKRFQLHLCLMLLAVSATSTGATIEIAVNGLVCAFCAQGVEKRLKKFPATAEVVLNLEQRLVAVSLKEGQDRCGAAQGFVGCGLHREINRAHRHTDCRCARETRAGAPMSEPQFTRNAGLAAGALLASSATLVCCVWRAVLNAPSSSTQPQADVRHGSRFSTQQR